MLFSEKCSFIFSYQELNWGRLICPKVCAAVLYLWPLRILLSYSPDSLCYCSKPIVNFILPDIKSKALKVSMNYALRVSSYHHLLSVSSILLILFHSTLLSSLLCHLLIIFKQASKALQLPVWECGLGTNVMAAAETISSVGLPC